MSPHQIPEEREWEKRFEDKFNKVFGFGIWNGENSRIYSSDVLEFCREFVTSEGEAAKREERAALIKQIGALKMEKEGQEAWSNGYDSGVDDALALLSK